MATTNPVFQVLPTSGNQAFIAAGSRPEALAVGQGGIFNYHTGLSIDGSVLADAQDIFIAVGVDPNGVGSVQDIITSAGQMIQASRYMKSYTFQGYLAGQGKIVDIAGYTAKCETEYLLRIEFRNSQIYTTNGYNQFNKVFNMRTACCSDQCEPCGTGDPNEVTLELVRQINADPDKLLVASYFVNAITATVGAEPTASGDIVVTVGTTPYTVAIVDADTVTTAAAKIVAKINTQTGSPYYASNLLGVITIYPKVSKNGSTETLVYTTPVAGMTITPIVAATKTTVANPTTFIAANPGVALGMRLTSQDVPSPAAGDISLSYNKVRKTDFTVALVAGFECNGTTTDVQNIINDVGKAYDLKQLEYEAGGWNGKPGPYRQSTLTGLAREGFQYYINPAVNYNQFILEYDLQSVGGWEEYKNNLKTILAIPCGDATTLSSVVAMLDAIFAGRFGAQAGDVAANGDCTNTVTSALTPATDGIESVA